ncbi:DNA/RNA non-specific endonuclease [Helicobacter sp. 11S02596-1]|uniref:DNA/RNA non-specific endonuclease n=1 Tax=Helicobacter sp. 11S02596-1 TaxID=1476194 RepID=UPI000BA54192|nr:DNA/RNA non-specific endonuclease [Helicobacter sp. 11S02596-1]PAF41364.1 hypothetical protein BJI48_08720 [Helicobacter sp. 11S02596-1]
MAKFVLCFLWLPLLLSGCIYTHYQIYPPFAKFFTEQNCDMVLDKFTYMNCYSYTMKGSKAVAYKLESKILALNPAGKRPPFRVDKALPEKYQTHPKDYTNSGYDRGHILANASMSATAKAQRRTFLMSNIVPQNPTINRKVWKKFEERERALALEFGSAEVLNLVIYPVEGVEHLEFITNHIAIPSAFVKIIITPSKTECYATPNVAVEDVKIADYVIDCLSLPH